MNVTETNRVWLCGRTNQAWTELQVDDGEVTICYQDGKDGPWHHGPGEPSLVTGKDHGCGWRTFTKRRTKE